MHRLSSTFVLAYHGCSSGVAESLLAGAAFVPSNNDYGWLGPGVYFWQSNPRRALTFAKEKKRREKATWAESVVGAVLEMGLCLDLTTEAGVAELRAAHHAYLGIIKQSGVELPSNEIGRPKLDCAVITALHDIRRENNLPSADTVLGVFFEGKPVYPNSQFQDKTHVQISVRNSGCIKGVFRVKEQGLRGNLA